MIQKNLLVIKSPPSEYSGTTWKICVSHEITPFVFLFSLNFFLKIQPQQRASHRSNFRILDVVAIILHYSSPISGISPQTYSLIEISRIRHNNENHHKAHYLLHYTHELNNVVKVIDHAKTHVGQLKVSVFMSLPLRVSVWVGGWAKPNEKCAKIFAIVTNSAMWEVRAWCKVHREAWIIFLFFVKNSWFRWKSHKEQNIFVTFAHIVRRKKYEITLEALHFPCVFVRVWCVSAQCIWGS